MRQDAASSRPLRDSGSAAVTPPGRRGEAAAPASGLPHPTLSIVGLGYVGAVSAACLAHLGFQVVGVDIDAGRVARVAAGTSPIVEARLAHLLADAVGAHRLTATLDLVAAVANSDVTLVSVGTPSSADGTCDLSFVAEVSRGIGLALANKAGFHVVVLRCSVPPGTTLGLVASTIEIASGGKLGVDFGVAFCPEFLREGSAVSDFLAPARTIIAASDARTDGIVRAVFARVGGVMIGASIEAAETVKYVDNVWHATKVVFANEVGRVCKGLDIDSHEVMGLFTADTKLNISAAYLKPGFAFGGSCLPKDVRAFARLAADRGIATPLCASLMTSNAAQVEEALRLLEPFRGKRIGVLGLAFKPGTDDLRESPMLTLIEALQRAGEHVAAFDAALTPGAPPAVQPAAVVALAGSPAEDAASLIAQSDVVVVGHATPAYREAVRRRRTGVHVIDLARLFPTPPDDPTYHGVSW